MEDNELLFEKNKQIKTKEINSIKNFKKIYNLIRKYEPEQLAYNKIIKDEDIRINFLIHAMKVTFENKEIDKNTKDIIFKMYEEIYNYLYHDSELKEIEIPQNIAENLFDRTFIPNNEELKFVLTLIKENKRIYEKEIEDKSFSQTLKTGLHKGITKELKIEKQNLSHLLGLTNDGSLYEFYRKTIINNKIIEILNSLGIKTINNISTYLEDFKMKFKDYFQLDFTQENYIKLINWRYDAKEEYLQKKGITVTEEERKILNQIYHFAPKSNTLNFYCEDKIIELIQQENKLITTFIHEYIRSFIIEKSNEKKHINELNKILNKEEIELILNKNIKIDEISNIIKKYIITKKYKFDEDKKFKISFINHFGYSYPLINYNEILSKNISFYNFSLFKNLNSIIVDYDSIGKKIESDVFLVSYSHAKINEIKEKIIKLIANKNKQYQEAINENILNQNLDTNYIMNYKSLLSFPNDKRYYFEYGFLSKDKRKQDDNIIKENTEQSHNITLIGFKLPEENNLELKKVGSNQKHFLNCETNISSNYYKYITDFTRQGIEYPIDMIEERNLKQRNRKTKILKIEKPLDRLNRYITLFENYKYNINNLSDKQILELEKLISDINELINNYETMTKIKIHIINYRLETQLINKEKMYEYLKLKEKEITKEEEFLKLLIEYKKYIHSEIEKQDIKTKIRKKGVK